MILSASKLLKLKRMVGLGRVELPTNGLGRLQEDNRRDVESLCHL
jgi:hypothetical protein